MDQSNRMKILRDEIAYHKAGIPLYPAALRQFLKWDLEVLFSPLTAVSAPFCCRCSTSGGFGFRPGMHTLGLEGELAMYCLSNSAEAQLSFPLHSSSKPPYQFSHFSVKEGAEAPKGSEGEIPYLLSRYLGIR